ncbi:MULTISPECIES: DUF1080 domain-containing protein [Xanthocytophaga]|uniref:DUF1080 domain-containing protein n=2 Tax=Xanthocytophaga TaxID=3078918 RepID=A0AAE3QP85_9BACT|nr:MULTISPECIES: DUF1080 domain-containing protein [Xanthocytophaga]MDJ1480700.1 DUF1080 domain-containing protein [Xanthocytophaga flavus]MDJ1506370.1 DUF1080 domain-containing protein [Xanthocytophaga agilis]
MKKTLTKLLAYVSIATFVMISCSEEKVGNNQLTGKEKEEGWVVLFDGKTTDGWHLYNKGKVPSAWIVQGDELYCKPDTFDIAHGDLISDKEFKNFDLKFEWKISEAGNSGVFFNVVEKDSLPTAWSSGPEYQLLENTHPDYAMNPVKRAGCLYGFAPQKNAVTPLPAGQWNRSEIKQVDGKVEFYLNDTLTAQQDLNSAEWKAMIANSNFKFFPEFGKSTKGHIALQDWSKGISFRNIKIKEL